MSVKYLWLGSFQTKEIFERENVHDIGLASGYASQKGLVSGIDALLEDGDSMDTVGINAYPAYPQYKKAIVKKIRWSRNGTSYDCLAGFVNLKYLNYVSRFFSLKHEVKKWCRLQSQEDEHIVIVYAPSVEKLQAAKRLKKVLGAKVFVIVPDIPIMVNKNANRLIRSAKQIAENMMKGLLASVDGFILYSKHMAEYYGCSQGKWIVMEGVFDEKEADAAQVQTKTESHDTIRLMYSGAIHKGRGIDKLLRAFESMRYNRIELWFTGEGPSDDLVHAYAAKDSRIKHFGYLKTREEVLALQSQADILLHTRDINAQSAAYCFPSKLFEYMVSEKPVLSVVIPGIPDEYFDYLLPISSLSEEGIETAIQNVLKMNPDELKERGKRAREFVLEQKTCVPQAMKMLHFINCSMEK